MKLAVLSDIHGNFEAFKACVDYFEKKKVDGYIFLGDYVGEFPNPEMSLGLLHGIMKKKPCFVLRGNKEEYILNNLGADNPEWDEYKSVVGMLRYGYNHSTDSERKFFETLPDTMVIKLGGLPALRICHGSPQSTREKLLLLSEDIIEEIEEDFIICGHTHEQASKLKAGKRIWNPGSVGLPINGEGSALCMMLYGENGEWKPDFLEIPYDVNKEIETMKREKLFEIAPFWNVITVDLLKGGSVSHASVLSYAMNLCKKETGSCEWPKIPEKYMKKAVDDLVFLE